MVKDNQQEASHRENESRKKENASSLDYMMPWQRMPGLEQTD